MVFVGTAAADSAVHDSAPRRRYPELDENGRYIAGVFQDQLGEAPRLGWLAPGIFLTEERDSEVYIWSSRPAILPVQFTKMLTADDHAKVTAQSHLACDTQGPLAEYADSGQDGGSRNRAFYTSAAPKPGTRAGMVERQLTAAQLAQARALLQSREPVKLARDTALGVAEQGPFFSVHAVYDSTQTLIRVALVLHDSAGAVLASEIDDGSRFDCDGCGVPMYEEGLWRMYDVQNVFLIPGFPYPVLLLDTSTVEGRALSLATFTPQSEYASYRMYESVVGCAHGA